MARADAWLMRAEREAQSVDQRERLARVRAELASLVDGVPEIRRLGSSDAVDLMVRDGISQSEAARRCGLTIQAVINERRRRGMPIRAWRRRPR